MENTFSGLSQEEYSKALSSYSKEVNDVIKKMFEDKKGPKILVKIEWTTGDVEITDEIEDEFSTLSENIENTLSKRYSVDGYEIGYKPNSIALFILGPKNTNVKKLILKLTPLVNTFKEKVVGKVEISEEI